MSTDKKRAAVEAQLPRLAESKYRVTSCKSKRYNCFAWAANDTDHVWSPTILGAGVFWPPGIPALASVAGVIEAFQTIGYEDCDSSDLETGFEKIAIFTDASWEPRHAARQLSDGTWTSKLGDQVDIELDELEAIGGALYGEPARYMRRRGAAQPPTELPRLIRVGNELIAWQPLADSPAIVPLDVPRQRNQLRRRTTDPRGQPRSTHLPNQDEPARP